MSSDRFNFLKSDINKKPEKSSKNEKSEKPEKPEKSEKSDKQEEKSKNRFLNPSKKEEQKKEESTRFKNLIPTNEDKKENKNENVSSAPTESNRFKDLITKEVSGTSKPVHKERKSVRDDYQNQNCNMFENSSKKNKFSIDNEEMFPTLTDDFDIQPVHKKEAIESIVNYKMLSDKIIIQSAFKEHTQQQEDENYETDRIDKSLEPVKYVKIYSDRKFHRDIIEKYTHEREIQKQREIERSFNEWNKRRIERLKDSDDYLYRWSEAKRNEMLYCIYTDGLDDYGDNYDSEEEEDLSDFNSDLMSKNKKSYSDL